MEEIEAWTAFDFPGRGDKFSLKKYRWNDFSGVGWDSRSKTEAIYKFVGHDKPGWSKDVDGELGNYDYL